MLSFPVGVASRCSAILAGMGTGAGFGAGAGASTSIGSFLISICFWTELPLSTLANFFSDSGASAAFELTFFLFLGFSSSSSTREMISPFLLSYCHMVSPRSYAFFDFCMRVRYCRLQNQGVRWCINFTRKLSNASSFSHSDILDHARHSFGSSLPRDLPNFACILPVFASRARRTCSLLIL
jgi:hypothetical protein